MRYGKMFPLNTVNEREGEEGEYEACTEEIGRAHV